MDLKPRQHFLDRYTVSHLIGEGSFSRVYKAFDNKVNRDVAIKCLMLKDPLSKTRFELEAKIISSLQNPATIRLYDYALVESTPFMILEYVRGNTLRSILDWRGSLPLQAVIHVLLQTLGSLQEAHRLGILHRDLKPSNLILYSPHSASAMECVKVLDFGVAKILAECVEVENPGRLTSEGLTVGTLRYMPREQMSGAELTPQTDLFSLGVISIEMLMGQHPYWTDEAHNPIELLARFEDVRIPESLDVPAGIKIILQRMVQVDPARRYDSAADVIDQLESFVDNSTQDTIETGRPVSMMLQDQTYEHDRTYISLRAGIDDD